MLGPNFTCLYSSSVGLLPTGVSGPALQFACAYNLLSYQDPPGHGWALWVVCRCLGDSSCLLGSDLQSSHCTLDEACEDLDWDTEKGLEAMACETEGFLPPKVMVRPAPGCALMAFGWRPALSSDPPHHAHAQSLAWGGNLQAPP